MTKVRLLGPLERLDETLRTVQDAGVLHLGSAPVRARLTPYAPPAAATRRRRQLLRILEDVDAALAELPVRAAGPAGEPDPHQLACWAWLARRTRRDLDRLAGRAAALEEERALLARYHELLGALETLLRARGRAPGAMAFHLVLRPDQAAALPRIRAALGELLGDAFELLDRPLAGGELAVLLIVPESRTGDVERLLARTRVQEVPLPHGYGTSLLDAVPRMRERERMLPRELAATRQERLAIARRHGPELARARAALHDRLARLEALPLTAVTSHAFVLEGWVPAAGESGLRRALEQEFGDAVVLETLGREEWRGEPAPVVLRNPRLFRPFELVTRMLPLPRYGTIDPTPYVAVFFPMFFGLMVGDAGYGAVMGLVALLLRRGTAEGTTRRAVAEVAGACAAFATVFGVLFGEYFGDLGHRWLGLEPLWMDRGEAILPFLALTFALGAVHVVLGLILGALSAGRAHPREALGRGITAVMVVLVIVALLAAVDRLPGALLTPAVIVLLILFPVLIVLEGIVAPIELLTSMGHILSYARIMALGTASVMLAVVANRMAGAMGSVLVGTLFALLFHLVNFALALFSPTIHALRLHYVEFFGTFYSPGGIRYAPLGHWTPPGRAA